MKALPMSVPVEFVDFDSYRQDLERRMAIRIAKLELGKSAF